MMEFVFNGVSSSALGVKVKNVNRPVLPSLRDQYEAMPGRHGSYLFTQPFGDRVIEADCVLIAQSLQDLRVKAGRVAAWLTTSRRAELSFSDEPDKYFMAKVSGQPVMEQILAMGQFTIEFTCEPFAYSTTETVEEWTAAAGETHGIYNDGSAEAAPIITITAAHGEIVSPSVTINDAVIAYRSTIPANSELVIDAQNYAAYKGMDRDVVTTGGYDPAEGNVIQFIDGEFPVLLPGPNAVVFNCVASTSADIKIQYRKRWL